MLVALDKEKDIAHVLLESIDYWIEAVVERRSVLNVNADSETVALKLHLCFSVMTIRGLLVTLDKEKDVVHELLENIDQRAVAGVERLSILNVNAESETVGLMR